MTIKTVDPQNSDLPDGVNSESGVLYLARLAAGFEGNHLPGVVIFGEEIGFSEITAFIKESKGRGYYRTTLAACTCPSFKFRDGPCKHQKTLSERLERKARIDERNRQRREERATQPDREDDIGGHGFNMPPEGWR